MKVSIFAYTTKGGQNENEDVYFLKKISGKAFSLVGYDEHEVKILYEWNPKEAIIVGVADGLGGHERSKQAALFLSEFLTSEENIRGENEYEMLIMAASRMIYTEGMGLTTLVTCYIQKNKVNIIHAGDSRVYLFRDDTYTEQLTRDHSNLEILKQCYELSDREAHEHPKYIMNNAIGSRFTKVSRKMISLRKGDRLLLLSDGSYLNLKAKSNSCNMTPEELMNYVKACSCEVDDNSTAVLVCIE